MRAQVERQYDEMERMSHNALMLRQAHHAKKLKMSDLFKRPADDAVEGGKAENMRKKADDTMAWLSQFAEFSDIAEPGGKE